MSAEDKELFDKLFKTVDELCKMESRFATVVMAGRQTGASMSMMFEKISDMENLENKENMKSIVARAYATPRFSSEGNRKEAIENFANKIYLECYVTRREEIVKILRSSK
jgi:hypothetical protein